MNQQEINERERKNPDNWSRPFQFYHSRRDNRVWVRKPQPWMGWSLNMAKPASKILVLLFVLLLVLLAAATLLVILH